MEMEIMRDCLNCRRNCFDNETQKCRKVRVDIVLVSIIFIVMVLLFTTFKENEDLHEENMHLEEKVYTMSAIIKKGGK